MHRGSSKGPGAAVPEPETLPLSASPTSARVEVEICRGASGPVRSISLPSGGRVRDVLRALGEPAEGSAVLLDERAVPLDEPVPPGSRLRVIPTFSGG